MTIQNLITYPLKSAKGILLPETHITRLGFNHDRYYAIANTNNQILTAREVPELLQIQPIFTDGGLQFCYTNTSSKTINISTTESPTTFSLFKKPVTAIPINNSELDSWFSSILKQSCKLVFICKNHLRENNKHTLSFNDVAPIHLVNLNSLNALNLHLKTPVTVHRFRPNIIVKDVPAFEEENWTNIRIGNCSFKVIAPTERCSLITLNEKNSVKDKQQEPLRTLAKNFLKNGKTTFGIYLAPIQTGIIKNTDLLTLE